MEALLILIQDIEVHIPIPGQVSVKHVECTCFKHRGRVRIPGRAPPMAP